MTSLIEQAALRLEQLRQAGVVLDDDPLQATAAVVAPPQPPSPAVAAPTAERPTSRRVQLDLDDIAASGIITPNAPRTTMADQYRVIKRPLIANAVGKGATTLTHGNLIMVTSAMSGEGKS